LQIGGGGARVLAAGSLSVAHGCGAGGQAAALAAQ
jgi:hypothetical protein